MLQGVCLSRPILCSCAALGFGPSVLSSNIFYRRIGLRLLTGGPKVIIAVIVIVFVLRFGILFEIFRVKVLAD